jgi:Rod binding domain-containing protein
LQPAAGQPAAARDEAKVRDAAQQFEALLIAQLLRTARESSGEESSDAAFGYAEEQFAAVMAKQGGLGLADLIAAGLSK